MAELLRRVEFADRVGVTVRTVERWEREGRGPKPIRIGRRTVRYRVTDIENWLDQLSESPESGANDEAGTDDAR